jgi:hypothetical protein
MVLTNEKIGVLKVVAFDGSPFKLFSLRFSTKFVQAPSCERPKTTLSLIISNQELFPNSGIASELFEKIRETCMQVVDSNIAIDSSPTLQISLEIVAFFEKICDGEPILAIVSNRDY